MWEGPLPPLDDDLRQGDLLRLVPVPKRGGTTLTVDGLQGTFRNAYVIVLDRCCTVEQRHTVLMAKIGQTDVRPVEHRFMQALNAREYVPGEPFATYDHLLEPHEDLPCKPGELRVVSLLERISLALNSSTDMEWLRENRLARMTVPARAQLRAKMSVHFAKGEKEDDDWLHANGYDIFGLPLQSQAE